MKFSLLPGLSLLLFGTGILSAVPLPGPKTPGSPNVMPCLVELSSPSADQVVIDVSRTSTFPITGKVTAPNARSITVRITNSHGEQQLYQVPVLSGSFAFDPRLARDVGGRTLSWVPSLLYVDFMLPGDGKETPLPEKEVLYILVDGKTRSYPDIVTPFTSGLIDDRGNVDAKSLTFPVYRTLTDLFMGSRGAQYYNIRNTEFRLEQPDDLQFFKDYLTMYDCLTRDGFQGPAGLRVKRTLWNSTYLKWFNDSNTDPASPEIRQEYGIDWMPYVFSNDLSDILISILYRSHASDLMPHDATGTMLDEGMCNLMALQHTDDRDLSIGYGRGSFFYGMFFDGKPMLNGTGWFRNPKFLDYVNGGVLNGRAAWALGCYLAMAPDTELKKQVAGSLCELVRWCLIDDDHMVSPQNRNFPLLRRSPHGYRYWRDPGEGGYLLLGMLAALEKYPDLMVVEPSGNNAGVSLKSLTVEGLNALVDELGNRTYWSRYANVDSEAVTALAIGSRQFPDTAGAALWGETADKVAQGWLRVQDPGHPGELTHFGLRLSDTEMTYHIPGISPGEKTNMYSLYQAGHWLQALVEVEKIHPRPLYEERMKRIIGFMAGNNAFNIRILNEMGWVNNWVDDLGDTGRENHLKYDPYPESTCFVQIGLYEYLEWLVDRP